MRGTYRRRGGAVCAVLLGIALLVGCSTSEAAPQAGGAGPGGGGGGAARPAPATEQAPPDRVALRTDRSRQSPGVVAAGGGDAPYNYGPSVMVDAGRYRMWWCSQLGIASPPGDDILLAESSSMDGPFVGPDGTAATPVFSGSVTGFDAMHTCDPSVIKVRGTYYLYYTGAIAGNHAHGNAIGLATSPDGRVWTRANGGRPIVTPAHQVANSNIYGAGQPSALYLNGWFYLMFTDTTGKDVGHNGGGQFVVRSTDPAFAKGVESLTPGGFRETSTSDRFRSVVDAFSADWMWVDTLAAFAIAHETADGTTITFWDRDFRRNPYQPMVVRGPWREGPGLVRRADGHAVVSVDDPCGKVAVDLVRGTREGAAGPTDLVHFGLDVVGLDACRDPSRALLALDGFAMPSPRRTIDLVVAGKVVRIDRRSVAEKLAIRILDERVPALDAVPILARLTPGAPARRVQGRGIGLVVDDRLWRISSAAIAELNSSPILDITPAKWDSYERGVDLVAPPR